MIFETQIVKASKVQRQSESPRLHELIKHTASTHDGEGDVLKRGVDAQPATSTP